MQDRDRKRAAVLRNHLRTHPEIVPASGPANRDRTTWTRRLREGATLEYALPDLLARDEPSPVEPRRGSGSSADAYRCAVPVLSRLSKSFGHPLGEIPARRLFFVESIAEPLCGAVGFEANSQAVRQKVCPSAGAAVCDCQMIFWINPPMQEPPVRSDTPGGHQSSGDWIYRTRLPQSRGMPRAWHSGSYSIAFACRPLTAGGCIGAGNDIAARGQEGT